MWLTGALGRGGTDAHRSAEAGLAGATVVGGLLPRGATQAGVRDVMGVGHRARVDGGAWITVVEHDPDAPWAVCFLDALGALARPPLPAGWRREPVTDADEPCWMT